MKVLAIIATLALASCAEFNPTAEQIDAVGGLVRVVVDVASGK